MTLRWQWSTFDELPAAQLYSILAARTTVFVVEQDCVYQDMDGLDAKAEHLIAWDGATVAAYLRVFAPGVKYAEASIGRVLTAQAHRGTGLGRELIARALQHIDRRYPHSGIRIGAQARLERFYASFDFVRVSDVYLEDDIAHIEMLRTRET